MIISSRISLKYVMCVQNFLFRNMRREPLPYFLPFCCWSRYFSFRKMGENEKRFPSNRDDDDECLENFSRILFPHFIFSRTEKIINIFTNDRMTDSRRCSNKECDCLDFQYYNFPAVTVYQKFWSIGVNSDETNALIKEEIIAVNVVNFPRKTVQVWMISSTSKTLCT